ncbi:hypothetical protein BCR35DRAFT_349111 [Leucosporidium creatinivorum]|uniref:TIGR02453 family protein n=1 Tax=Leucosporidium creatinivorum TaxID=106004 RepID=A0A1Y2G6V5_9BASI|nr:hypothetical protein BCR35DRAFT_349111 [Leucosporidium creatinivorum]
MAKAVKDKTSKATKGKAEAVKPSKAKRARLDDSDASVTSTDDDEASSYEQGTDEGSVVVVSDDEEEEEEATPVSESDLDDDEGSSKKRKKGSSSSGKKSKDDRNTRVVKKVKKVQGPDEDATTAVILPTTIQFLKDLIDHNDREWFQENDARYRHALTNFTTFIQSWVPLATEADWSLPHLPAKELMQRVYRDVRFSKDKTPYKTYLSASHSRTGRKGPFALYYVQIGANGRSLLAAGYWQPATDSLKKIRRIILEDSAPLRKILKEPSFVKYFGEPDAKKGRTSVFGQEDQLKNAPKMEGVTKDHPEIDLLKLRSFAVSHSFTDSQITSPTFLKDTLIPVMEAAAPFVQYLNEMVFPTPASDDEGEAGDEQEEEGEGEGEGGSPQTGGEDDEE